MKRLIKSFFTKKLHAIDRQQYDVVNAIVVRGIPSFIELKFEDLKRELLEYVQNMEINPYSYKYAASCEKPCLYASVYAVMIEGLLGVLNQRSRQDLLAWGDYFNTFQNPGDGLYYDPSLECAAYEHIGDWNEGWGKHHLMGHMIIALARLGVLPKYPLRYLEKYYDQKFLLEWMNRFDFGEDIWTASNYFMNLYTVMQYVRDYMGELRAGVVVKTMTEWIKAKQNPQTGMWHSKPWNAMNCNQQLNVVRAAYHFYPLYEYEEIPIPHSKNIVEHILPLQNSWGGWTNENGNAGACEDIDAVEPLIRCAYNCPELCEKIEFAIRRSMIWQLSCRNQDKGFSFYSRAKQVYGGHPLTTSQRDESSMFATWFRTLCLAYEMRFLNLSNDFDIGRYPGYEIS